MNKKIYILSAVAVACIAVIIVLGFKLKIEVATSPTSTEVHVSSMPTPTAPVVEPNTTVKNKPYSYGRFDECCFKGWAYDDDKPITYSITLENIDHPGIKKSFVRTSTEPQTEFSFGSRDDVVGYLRVQGVVQVTNNTGFTFTPQEPLYPGRYRLGAATYNGKPLDTTSMLSGALFAVEWGGEYERRYSPIGQEYIEHKGNFDVLHDLGAGKNYPITPRADLITTSNAQWSPDAKYIAYTYSATPQAGYSTSIFNVITPQEIKKQKYENPSRVLLGGDRLRYAWLDNNRVVVVELIEKQAVGDKQPYFLRANIQVYNVATGGFEYPMKDYINKVYGAYISPDNKKFLFDVSDPVPGNDTAHAYIVTDITGTEIKRLAQFNGSWYDK